MKVKIITTLCCITFCISTTQAQLYKNALGFRVSGVSSLGGAGVSFKHYMNESRAVEAIFSFKDPIGIGGLYEVHKPWAIIDNLNWFYGGGAFVTFGKTNTDKTGQSSAGFGSMGIIGVDYKFEAIPLNISLDWKPEIAFVPKFALNFNTFALSMRVTLDKKQ
jgi:hypothetical protein